MYTPSLTIDQVIVELADFLTLLCPGYEIVRSQVNRVPMPSSPCVVLTEILQVDLETPVGNYDGVNSIISYNGSKRIDIQIDFYGSDSGNQCAAVKGIYRTPWTTDQFPANIQPLYCDDGRQMPLITGEEQYENRWTLTASLQYNPIVSLPQESAIELDVAEVIAVDINYEV